VADIEPNDRNARKILSLIRTKKDNFWSREREQRPLKLFHEAARRVPAYKDFLKKNHIDPNKIKNFKDFQQVPLTSKKDYLRKYPLEKLSWDGHLKKPIIFTSTSGSTGEPFYFPREHKLDWDYSILLELFLKNSSYQSEGPVLIIVGFGMGVWIGGLITYQGFEIAGRRSGLPISIITPGINKSEIFHALRNLSPNFKETIIVGYPPFIKDIIDEAKEAKVDFRKINLRFLSAAEAYTEKFRDYVVNKGFIKNTLADVLNVYGTADIGAMAWETPTSIWIRRQLIKRKNVFEKVFPHIVKTPTLAQYNPFFITFESQNEEVILSGNNTVPLIRYAVGDHGGVYNFSELKNILDSNNINIKSKTALSELRGNIYELPFVYVYERKDLSTTLCGLQIYPEIIREALLNPIISEFLTGKFTMFTKFDKKQNQFLELNLELRKNKKITPAQSKKAQDVIVLNLRLKISEFRELHNYLKKRALPKLVFWPSEHPLYFRPGVKQKWVKK
jgi:phenylacetate-CoA ligase